MLPNSTSIPGRAEPRPTLADLAIETITPDSTPVRTTVFPDKQVPASLFRSIKAPLGSRLVVKADDTIGRSTKMIEESTEISFYNGEIGWHGRERTIPYLDIDRALEEKAMAVAMGQDADPLFDLEAWNVADMQRLNNLHSELLAGLQLLDDDSYLPSHIYDGTLDVVNDPQIREKLFDANNAIMDDGVNLPATVTVIGVGARRGLQRNPAFLNLLPEDQIKRLREDDLLQILEMPSGARIVFPNLRVQWEGGAQPVPLLDNFIGVYRVVPVADRVNATFGYTHWKADSRNGQRVYVNSQKVGVAEDLLLGLFNWYKINVVNPAMGYKFNTESPDIDES